MTSSPPSSAPATSPGMRFDHLLYDLVSRNNGIFIGERHDHPAMRQALVHLMPALRARGIQTVSVELPQTMVDEMLRAESTDAWIRSLGDTVRDITGGEDVARDYCNLVRTAHRNGMRVLGHECEIDVLARLQAAVGNLVERSPAIARIMERQTAFSRENPGADMPEELREAFTREIAAIQSDPSRRVEREAWQRVVEAGSSSAVSEINMNERNRLAAEYIRANAVGKVLVLGGAFHSGNHSAADARGIDREPQGLGGMRDIIGEASSRNQRTLRRGLEVTQHYRGLDQRLGYPSIDYNCYDASGRVGQTVRTDGRFNHHEVVLPSDLRLMNITSWPPPGGVPTIESLGASASPTALPTLPLPRPTPSRPAATRPAPGGPVITEPAPSGPAAAGPAPNGPAAAGPAPMGPAMQLPVDGPSPPMPTPTPVFPGPPTRAAGQSR